MSHLAPRLFTVLLFVAASALSAAETPGKPAGVGEVAFANSGAEAAQPAFLRGLALLHNFEYEDAAESFRQAQALDPGFAMAYWGEAMTHTHPVWMQQDLEAARTVLERLAPTPAARAAKAPSERERAYLRAVEVLYGEGSKEQRDRDFAGAMAALHEQYPADVDAAAFHALALLGTAHEGRDFATYMRAAAVLEEVFPAHPRHPGVLHYLIHCYDDAVHAPLGVRAARLYGAVAPDAGHALHMTSHIFIALGDWDEVIAANRQAMGVVNHHHAAKDEASQRCGHYVDWLFYAYLQTGRRAEAERELEGCRQEAIEEAAKPESERDPNRSAVGAWSLMRLQYAVDVGVLPAASLPAPTGDDLASARFAMAYADAYVAARAGDAARVREAAVRLAAEAEAAGQYEGKASPMAQKMVAAVRGQVEALLRLADGKRAEGLELLARAAEAEDAIPLVFGPPGVEKPTRELLAEELLAAGRPADAKAAAAAALARAPGRTASLRVLLQAQTALGEREEAARTQAELDRNLAGGGAAGAPKAGSSR